MSILSVSLPAELENFIEKAIASGEFETKSQVVKKALRKLEEDLIIERLKKSSREIREGKFVKGDIKKLIKEIK